jgi:hypothetical protein
MTPEEGLLAVSALHAGFQSVVTVVVYPALRDLPPERWAAGHAAHSRRITYLVVPLYTAVTAACVWVLLAGSESWPVALAVVGNAAALAVTALVAAPAHSRLGRVGQESALLARLLLADRVRLAATLLAVVAAALA